MKTPDKINRDRMVARYQHGVMLIKPDEAAELDDENKIILLSELMNMPFSVYMLSMKCSICECTSVFSLNYGVNSYEEARGSAANQHDHDNQFLIFRKSVNQVIESKMPHVSADLISGTHAINFKFPVYNAIQHMCGVLVCSVEISNESSLDIANKVAMICNLFCSSLFNQYIPQNYHQPNQHIFSVREVDVIKLVIRGKTMREIAEILGLSRRTVESYFLNIKVKLNVKTKSEFFDRMKQDFDYLT